MYRAKEMKHIFILADLKKRQIIGILAFEWNCIVAYRVCILPVCVPLCHTDTQHTCTHLCIHIQYPPQLTLLTCVCLCLFCLLIFPLCSWLALLSLTFQAVRHGRQPNSCPSTCSVGLRSTSSEVCHWSPSSASAHPHPLPPPPVSLL